MGCGRAVGCYDPLGLVLVAGGVVAGAAVWAWALLLSRRNGRSAWRATLYTLAAFIITAGVIGVLDLGYLPSVFVFLLAAGFALYWSRG